MKRLIKQRLAELDELEAVWRDIDFPWETLDFLVKDTAEQCARAGLDFYKDAPENPTLLSARCWLVASLNALTAQKTGRGLLTLREAAALLGYTEKGLRKIVDRSRRGRNGQKVSGPTIDFHQAARWGTIKFKREWIEAFIETHKIEPIRELPSIPRPRPGKSHGLCYDLLAR
jgi:hypothetical protein